MCQALWLESDGTLCMPPHTLRGLWNSGRVYHGVHAHGLGT